MSIWYSLLIPIIGAAILLKFFTKRLTWWEVCIPLFTCLIFILGFKAIVEKTQVSDTEYWGSLIVKATYYEAYTTWEDQTCTRTVSDGVDSNGNAQSHTETYDCSYCDENGPRWEITNSLGETWDISQEYYEGLRKKWSASPQFIELNRDIEYDGDCGLDGDAYEIKWNQLPLTAESTTTEHTYENRIQAAHTAFDYPDITETDKKQYKLFDYTEVENLHQETVLGLDSIKWVTTNEKNRIKQWAKFLNGKLGVKKHARIFFLFFSDTQPLTASMQEAYWDGGNDNELVICIGLSKSNRNIQWVKPFTWSPTRKIIPDVREDIMNIKVFDIDKIANSVWANVDKEYKRKDFEEFSYVSVDTPTWAKWVTFIVTLLITSFICYWAIDNDIDSECDPLNDIFDKKDRNGYNRYN
jgi:hypothetical protein